MTFGSARETTSSVTSGAGGDTDTPSEPGTSRKIARSRVTRTARNASPFNSKTASKTSLGRALRSHFLHLRTMGQLGLPPEIEMG